MEYGNCGCGWRNENDAVDDLKHGLVKVPNDPVFDYHGEISIRDGHIGGRGS